MAITVDDLPGGGTELVSYTHAQMLRDIITALQTHHVPRAAGFIVGEMLKGHPERNAALDAWVAAGFLAGNHTYSHEKLAEVGLQRFMADIVKNREVIDPIEKRSGQRHSYFRFPYLEEGATREERDALRQRLAREHYTLARVSLRFGDTDWAAAYIRCAERGDRESLAALDHSYVAHAVAQLRWSVAAARQVFGHAIPHVLLLHVNMPTAKNLHALLQAYQTQCVRFIGLDDALREAAYTAQYNAPGGDLLEQASAHLGRQLPPRIVGPAELIDRLCR